MTATLELLHTPTIRPPVLRAPLSRFAVPVLYLIFAAYCAVVSHGFLEADETSHFLFARSVWNDWTMVLSIWGRFGCSALYAAVAPFGIVAARLLAVGITALVGLGTSILLKQLVRGIGTNRSWVARHGVAIAWMLLFAQPCFALNCFTIMTEMLLAVTWVWAAVALFAYRRSTVGVMLGAFLLGLGGLMRPEGWLAIAAWPIFVAFWLKSDIVEQPVKRYAGKILLSTFLAGLPVLCWYLMGLYAYHNWLWIVERFPWSAKSQYGARAYLFLLGAIGSMGLWMWWPILLGIWETAIYRLASLRLFRRRKRFVRSLAIVLRWRTANFATWSIRRRTAFMLLTVPLAGMYLMHGILGGFGLFGSMALPRYFISIAPMGAILAIMGLVRIEEWIATRRWTTWLRPLLILAMIWPLAGFIGTGVLPSHPNRGEREMDVITDVIQSRLKPSEYEDHVMLGHPYMNFKLGLPIWSKADEKIFVGNTIQNAPAGTLLVAEPGLWNNEQHPSFDKLREWGWKPDEEAVKKISALTPQWWDHFRFDQDPSAHSVLWVKQ